MKKKLVLAEFSDLKSPFARDVLAEFPEFPSLAERAGIRNFADAFGIYSNYSNTTEDHFKQCVARFIIWLALADKGEFKVVIGKTLGFKRYKEMSNMVGSHIEIYHQAQMYYQEAKWALQKLDRK